MHQHVLRLTIDFRFDLEQHSRDIENIRRALRRPAHPTMHRHRGVALVVRTSETAPELMERMAAVLSTDRIVNAWCETVVGDIVSIHGEIDPLVMRVREAYAHIRQASQAKNMGKAKTGQVGVERPIKNLKSGAPIQVFRKLARKRQVPRDPNSQE